MQDNQWQAVWGRKGAGLEAVDPQLEDLIRADGFDSGAGDHTLESWSRFADQVYSRMQLSTADRVLEVGCGSGAFLWSAYQLGASVSGVDYSEQLLGIAGRAMPEGNFVHAEAASLPLPDDSADIVLSHSVFQYFPSLDYAEQCLQEILRVASLPAARLAILDVNDAEKEEAFYRLRQAQLDGEDYHEKYRGLPHRFYQKSWFAELLKAADLEVDIVDQDIPDYGNSAFRFNVFAQGKS